MQLSAARPAAAGKSEAREDLVGWPLKESACTRTLLAHFIGDIWSLIVGTKALIECRRRVYLGSYRLFFLFVWVFRAWGSGLEFRVYRTKVWLV